MSNGEDIFILSCPFTSPLPRRVHRNNRRGQIIWQQLKRKQQKEGPKTKQSLLQTFSSKKELAKRPRVEMTEMEKLEVRSKMARAKLISPKAVPKYATPHRILAAKKAMAASSDKIKMVLPTEGKKLSVNGLMDISEIPPKKLKSGKIKFSKIASDHPVSSKLKDGSNIVYLDASSTNNMRRKKMKLNRKNFVQEEKT